MTSKARSCVTNVTRSAEDKNSVTDEVQNPKMSRYGFDVISDNIDTEGSSNKK